MKRNDWQSCWRLTARRWSSWWSESTNGMRIPRLSCWSWTNATRWQRGQNMRRVIRQALEVKNNTPLSQAALEVLAIIAYNQPVTKSFIEQIRGVDSSSVVNALVAKELVQEMGRLEIPGRPISYGTTEHFLRCFGMKSIETLPKLPQSTQNAQEGEQA